MSESAPATAPRPWSLKETGGHLTIRDAKGKAVVRRSVNHVKTLDDYNTIKANYELIVASVNGHEGEET